MSLRLYTTPMQCVDNQECTYRANRCPSCGRIGIFDSEKGKTDIEYKYLIRTTSRMIPGADHPYPFVSNLSLVWLSLIQYPPYTDTPDLYWLRLAFADQTWKTYEQDLEYLTLEEGLRAFEDVSRQISMMPYEPDISTLFNHGFNFG